MSELKKALRNGIVKVTFTKKNGDERVMYATTNMNTIPDECKPKGTDDRNYPDDVYRVVDTEITEWRSFRKDSVIDWEVVE